MEMRRGDYTARDAASLREAAKAELARRFPGIVFDLEENSSSVENVMMSPSFYIGDGLHLYVDASHSEGFLATLAEKKNAENKAKDEGYPISRKVAALAELDYTYTKNDPGAPDSLVLDRGTSLSAAPTKSTWTVVEPQTVVLAGGTFVAYQGIFVSDVFSPAVGVPDQFFTLSRKNVASNIALKVTVGGTVWAEVERVSRAGMTNSFQVEFFGETVRVRLGDGANGNLPVGDVVIQYFTTQGTSGSAAIADVTGDYDQSDVTVSFSNNNVAAGSDGDSVSDYKKHIPGYARTQDRLVSSDDYVQAIERHPGVMYASMEYNRSLQKKIFYVMALGYTEPSQSLLDEIDASFRGKNQEFTMHDYRPVKTVGAVISMSVKLFSSVGRAGQAMKKQEILDEVHKMFYPEERTEVYNNAVGRSVGLSDVYRVVETVKGVDRLQMKAFTRQPELLSENWSEGANDIVLGSWSVSSSSFGSAVSQMSSLSGLDSGDRDKASSGSVFGVTLSPARRSWQSWPSSGIMRITLEKAFRRRRKESAHFEVVTTYFDGSTSPTISNSYLGVDMAVGFGFFTFQLTAPTAEYSFTESSPSIIDGYPVFKSPHGMFRVGSLSGVVSNPSTGVTTSFTDNGSGSIVDVLNRRIGYVDYDTGGMLFTESGYTHITGVARRYVHTNKISEKADIVVSPPVGDIPVRPKEFCGIYSLQVEVSS